MFVAGVLMLARSPLLSDDSSSGAEGGPEGGEEEKPAGDSPTPPAWPGRQPAHPGA